MYADPTNEEFKILNKIYNSILENKIFFSNSTKIDIELEKIISQILHYDDIVIEIIGSWIWLSGKTKTIKEHLKEIGFKWASKKRMWYYGEMKKRNIKTKSIDEIKAKYGCSTISKNKDNKKIT
jgi:hypothetical protein